MTSLWTIADILKALSPMSTENLGPAPISGISIDSRTTQPGDLFFAIKGPNKNGHDYVSIALKNGAVGYVISEDVSVSLNAPFIRVRDTLESLDCLAAAARNRCQGRIIAVTGSAGKTSTKNMLAHALMHQGKTFASPKSYNNCWGVPFSLSSMPKNTKFGIFELGMNHANEISPLSKLVQPHVAIITHVGTAHLEFFNSVEDIAHAKSEILDGIPKSGIAVLNKDNAFFTLLCNKARELGHDVISFGSDERADFQLLSYSDTARTVKARMNGLNLEYEVGLPGLHQAYNSLAVLAAVHASGGNVSEAASSLATIKPGLGRGAVETISSPTKTFTLIDESYNANPDSVRSLIRTLGKIPTKGRKHIVLGDMRELGPRGAELHQALSQDIIDEEIDVVHTCGELMKHLYDALPQSYRGIHAADSASLKKRIVEAIQDNDIVAIKGSLSTNMALVINTLKSLHLMHKGETQCS